MIRWSYVGTSRSVVLVQNPGGRPPTFVLSVDAFDDMRHRNPHVTFVFEGVRQGDK